MAAKFEFLVVIVSLALGQWAGHFIVRQAGLHLRLLRGRPGWQLACSIGLGLVAYVLIIWAIAWVIVSISHLPIFDRQQREFRRQR